MLVFASSCGLLFAQCKHKSYLDVFRVATLEHAGLTWKCVPARVTKIWSGRNDGVGAHVELLSMSTFGPTFEVGVQQYTTLSAPMTPIVSPAAKLSNINKTSNDILRSARLY